jgi:hypothetical protein
LQSEAATPLPGNRILNWFLASAELGRAREAASPFSRERREYLRRANLAFEMAELSLAPGNALRSGSAVPLASNLFRESIYWALLGHGLGDAQNSPAELWAAADDQLLSSAGVESSERTELGHTLASTFVELADQPAERQHHTNQRLRLVAKGLLTQVQAPLRKLESAQHKRLTRLLLVAGLCLGLFALVMSRVLRPVNLARATPWRTSSTYAECHPKQFECAGASTDIFFHTHVEKNPWFEYDFGAPLAFSSLTVRNRLDYGLELSSPIVAEVSNDGKTYREVARREDWFTTWRPSFPKQHARYLRLRVLRTSAFHLKSVAVHP